MESLENRILGQGIVRSEEVLSVDMFLNHQMDVALYAEMARQWQADFADAPVNKVLTIEASGIGIAAIVAATFGVPCLFAKKSQSINIGPDAYTTKVQSFTHGRVYDVIVSKKYLGPNDHVLIIDDFLANGCAIEGLVDLCAQAGATVEGVGVAVEKGFQGGGDRLRASGIRVDSLAIVESMDPVTGSIEFRREHAG